MKRRLFVKFLSVGLFATLIHYGGYLFLLKGLKLQPLSSNFLAFLVSFIVNFVLTHLITFKVSFSLKKTIGFILTHSAGFILNQLIFYVLSYTFIPDMLIPLIVIPIVTCFNFFFIRFVFQYKSDN